MSRELDTSVAPSGLKASDQTKLMCPYKLRHLLAPPQVGEPDRPVIPGRGQVPTIGVEGHRENLVDVPVTRAAVDRLEAEGPVQAARGELPAVGAEGGQHDQLLVAAEAGVRFGGQRVQEEDSAPVSGNGGHPAADGVVDQGYTCGREEPLAEHDVTDVELVLALPVDCCRSHTLPIQADGQ